jgi:hypothetical protein
MAEERTLPGWPKKKLVLSTKRWLRLFGITPKDAKLRLETWQWANQIAHSYLSRVLWPTASEIAARYAFLLMLRMHQEHALKLPCRAGQYVPQTVAARLGGGSPLPLIGNNA